MSQIYIKFILTYQLINNTKKEMLVAIIFESLKSTTRLTQDYVKEEDI